MKRRDIVIGLIVLAVIAAVVYWVRRPKEKLTITPPSVEEKLEESFNLQIPDDVEKAELSDVTGGNASGIATRKYEEGTFSHTVLADLADPPAGRFYEGWLVKGEKVISTGKFRVAKGGYLLEFKSGTDYSDYGKVVVTLEEKDDKTPETHVLEGTFK